MARRFYTEVSSERIWILVVGTHALFCTTLARALLARHIDVIYIDPETGKRTPFSQVDASMALSASPHAVYWVDGGVQQKGSGTHFRELTAWITALRVPVFHIGFDAFSFRDEHTPVFPSSYRVVYQHVFVPDATVLSHVQERLRQEWEKEEPMKLAGVIAPLWFEDCIYHITKLQYEAKTGLERVGADTTVSLSDFQKELSIQAGKTVPSDHAETLSFHFIDAQTHIPTRPVEEIIRVLSTFEKSFVQIQPVVEKLKKKGKRHPAVKLTRKTVLGSVALLVCGISLMVLLISAFTAQALHATRHIILSAFTKEGEVIPLTPSRITGYKATIAQVEVLRRLVPISSSFLGLPVSSSEIATFLVICELAVEALEEMHTAQQFTSDAFFAVSQKEERSVEQIAKAQSHWEEAYRLLSLSQGRVSGSADAIRAIVSPLSPSDLYERLGKLRKTLSIRRMENTVLLELLKSEERRTYAILWTDPSSIRASGGVPSVVTLVELEKGKWIESAVYASTHLEKELLGDASAPSTVLPMLTTGTWNLTDVSHDASFPAVASHSAWFLSKQTGKSISGVLQLSLARIPELVQVVDGVVVEGQVIDAAQAREMLEKASKYSASQADALRVSLIQALIQKINSEPSKGQRVFPVLEKELQEGGAGLYFTDGGLQKKVQALGWEADIKTPACPDLFATQPCTVSTVLWVENGFASTVSGKLHKTITHTVRLRKETTHHERVVEFTRQVDLTQGGDEEVQRFLATIYVDEAASEIQVGSESTQSASFYTDIIERKRRIVFPVQVSSLTPTTVRVSYQTPKIVPESSFVFFEQRPLGGEQGKFTLRVVPDDTLTPTTIAPQAKLEEGHLVFTSDSDTHLLFAVGF